MKPYRISLVVAVLLAHCLLYSSTCLAALINVEPDLFPAGTDIRNSYPGVTLSVNGQPSVPVLTGVEGGCGGSCASTGTQVFGPQGLSHWQFAFAEFRADFASLTDFVSIDFVGVDNGDVKAEIYDLNGVLLDSFITNLGGEGDNATASFTRPVFDIAYILAGGVPGEGVSLDNLVVSVPDTAVPEPSTLGLIGLGLLGLGAMRRRRRFI
jgi:PEP-CTERM motif